MLRPFRFLWEQLNGPQVTALFTAIFKWLQVQFNPLISYFRNFSILTASDDHLTIIGICMGIVRPMITIANEDFFLFTRDPGVDETRGFADLNNRDVGGRFSDLNEDLSKARYLLCPAEYYREILLSYTRHLAAKDSLVFMDNVLNDVWEAKHPDEPSPITFRFYTENETPNRTLGDIDVTIGTLNDWGTDAVALEWQAVFSGIFNALFNPERYVDVNFKSS